MLYIGKNRVRLYPTVPHELGIVSADLSQVPQAVIDAANGTVIQSSTGWNKTVTGSYVKLVNESVFYTYRAYALQPGTYVYGYNGGSSSTAHKVTLTTSNSFPYELRTNNEQVTYALAY